MGGIPPAGGVPLGRGAAINSLPWAQGFSFTVLPGREQRPPCPHSNKSGGEGGTQGLAFSTTLPGGGRARFGEGQTLPAGAYAQGARAYA